MYNSVWLGEFKGLTFEVPYDYSPGAPQTYWQPADPELAEFSNVYLVHDQLPFRAIDMYDFFDVANLLDDLAEKILEDRRRNEI